MKLASNRPRVGSKSRETVLVELKRVAAHYAGRTFSRHEFDRVAESCKGTTVIKVFGSWPNALRALGLDLTPHKASRTRISEAELFTELERIWNQLGHRPSKIEWEAAEAKFSYTTYKQRFGGWTAACAKFLESKGRALPSPTTESPSKTLKASEIRPQEKRGIPLKLRLKVLERDQFRCVLCGQTPALNPGAVLHIDHILAFARGGKTEIGNLRTLCRECNLGKGAT